MRLCVFSFSGRGSCHFFQVIMANRHHFVVDLINGRAVWRNKCVGIGRVDIKTIQVKKIHWGPFLKTLEITSIRPLTRFPRSDAFAFLDPMDKKNFTWDGGEHLKSHRLLSGIIYIWTLSMRYLLGGQLHYEASKAYALRPVYFTPLLRVSLTASYFKSCINVYKWSNSLADSQSTPYLGL